VNSSCWPSRDDDGGGDPGGAPIYPATEGLTHRQIRALVQQHLDVLLPLVTDPHPPHFARVTSSSSCPRALELMHRPKRVEEAELGRRRLAFDELFDQQLVQARARHLAKRARAGFGSSSSAAHHPGSARIFPFELTTISVMRSREICGDMTAPLRMHRLLMGDVGTGKTVVRCRHAARRRERVSGGDHAPTELLAEQHGATLTRLLEPLADPARLLLGPQ